MTAWVRTTSSPKTTVSTQSRHRELSRRVRLWRSRSQVRAGRAPALADQVLTKAVVPLLLDQDKTECLIDPACRGEDVVGPQAQLPVASVAGEPDALLDEQCADTEPTSPGRGRK